MAVLIALALGNLKQIRLGSIYVTIPKVVKASKATVQ
jgi:hypothetical protein